MRVNFAATLRLQPPPAFAFWNVIARPMAHIPPFDATTVQCFPTRTCDKAHFLPALFILFPVEEILQGAKPSLFVLVLKSVHLDEVFEELFTLIISDIMTLVAFEATPRHWYRMNFTVVMRQAAPLYERLAARFTNVTRTCHLIWARIFHLQSHALPVE